MKPYQPIRLMTGAFLSVLACSAQAQVAQTPEVQFNSTEAAELLGKATELKTPVAIYEYLRNNAEYVPYWGSRSGSVNTFMGLRGNDVDLASTLIAMLRSQGIPARYARGVVQVPNEQMLNWADDTSAQSAAFNLQDSGLRDLQLNTTGVNAGTFQFTHAWVQALVPYDQYRGATLDSNSASTVDCKTAPTKCTWVDLDPSYKQRQYKRLGLDPWSQTAWGDAQYTAYFDAIKNNDAYRKDKNPVTILEQDVLAWLRGNSAYAGRSLEDVIDAGAIIPAREGLLPASLPYQVVSGSVTTYDSVALHDAAQTNKWDSKLTVTVQACDPAANNPRSADSVSLSLSTLSTDRLALVYTPGANNTVNLELRRGRGSASTALKTWNFGSVTCSAGGKTMAKGSAFYLLLDADVMPGSRVGPYRYEETVGERIVIATGGETSNWSQTHRAATHLLKSSTAVLVYSADKPLAGQTCQADSGIGCVPYVDNGNGTWDAADVPLTDDPVNGVEMTLALLDVAGTQYTAQLRDRFSRADGLMRTHTPIRSLIGIVKSNYEVQYLADTSAFGIQPNGLVIDFYGVAIGGATRRGSSPAARDSKHSYFLANVMSSLEHEVWQAITGLDAMSTVRTIQMARGAGSALKTYVKNATVNDRDVALTDLGFSAAPPSPWTTEVHNVYGTRPTIFITPTWDGTQRLEYFRRAPASSADRAIYYNVNTDTSSGRLVQRLANCAYSLEDNPPTAPWVWYAQTSGLVFTPYDNPNPPCFVWYRSSTGQSFAIVGVTQVRTDFRSLYLDFANNSGKSLMDFIDANKGFNASDFVYRSGNIGVGQYQTEMVLDIARQLNFSPNVKFVMTKEPADLGAAKAQVYIGTTTYDAENITYQFAIGVVPK
jgi:hypothetical protein